MANVTTTLASANANINGLLGEYQWGRFQFLTFGIPRKGMWSGYPEGSEPYVGYDELTSAQTSVVQRAISFIDGISDSLWFRELSNESTLIDESEKPQNADLRFGRTLADPEIFTAFAYTPEPETPGASSGTADKLSGDVWLYNDDEDSFEGSFYADPQAGNYEYFTILHEIGHAMGMRHPHETLGSYAAMPLATDQMSYTVMSYRSYEGHSTDAADGYTNGDWDFPQTYMIWDIATFQHMYGASFSHRSEDTLYSWNPVTGETRTNASTWILPGANRVFLTIWDGGGIDTYDFAAYSSDLTVDLNPEAWTVTSPEQLANLGDGHFAPGNIANARLYGNNLGSLIENAIGGSGNDSMIGNQVANSLTGNAGDDVLDGRIGADTLTGGLGDDLYIVDNAGDLVVESLNQGGDGIETSISLILPANVEELKATVHTGLTLTGNDLVNIIVGGNGNDVLDGKTGADSMIGGAGNDTYHVDNSGDAIGDLSGTDTVFTIVSYALIGDSIENVTLGGSASIGATGNGLANTLTGNGGDNLLDGRGGVDVLIGGAGNDIYVIDDATEAVEGANAGTDEIRTALAVFTLTANFENLTGLAAVGQTLTGNAGANIINGSTSADIIDGGAGADTLAGGLGNDSYTVDVTGDLVTEGVNGGTDSVQASATFVLGANIERLTLTGPAAIDGTGNALANQLTGNGAANRLDGGAGADSMVGGLGDDIYVLDNLGDLVTEASSAGTDTVESSVNHALGANVERLTLTGAALNATGNGLANTLIGNGLNNILDGLGGADTMGGGLGHDTYVVDNAGDLVTEAASAGNDTVQASITFTLGDNVEHLTLTGGGSISGTGNGLNNIINGNNAANFLNGGVGADFMTGGGGDDTYFVDNASDKVTEIAGGGTDTVNSSVNWTLGAEVERLVLNGTASLTGIGNDLANIITGNAAANTLNGGVGADTMQGGLGNDTYVVDNAGDVTTDTGGVDTVQSSVTITLHSTIDNLILTGAGAVNGIGNGLWNVMTGNGGVNTLDGGVGNDILNGGLGADILIGGAGHDTYHVDDIGDQVIDTGGGNDHVHSSIDYVLGADLEYLTLTGGAVSATGNAKNNLLYGNAGNNVIDGGLGADFMVGGNGNDTYYVENGSDQITEHLNQGTDTVMSSVHHALRGNIENLTLIGTNAVSATGNELNNIVTGNSANNVITGGLGADSLSGGGGNDTYQYRFTTESTAAAKDQITGFNAGDKINLSILDANTGTSANNDAFTFIGADAFHNVAGELRATESGGVWTVEADVNGDGLADLVIGLTTEGGYLIGATDFML